ncbi:hypothetical protein K450DRAFT_271849 [Umbelopsis ramanniana AG]|uniref:Mannosyltransferase n=1 Tax=Umbelopsis ramanniana AG TaxID=1314678 RepID=A0AAD5HE06_UMBRA|nr:uncharacterized protein K450DRAFT_271849 [Umbelopsis ramanniana AG]KAI8579539.1 hypothetical protein K450DRAFT_271849 [Umbelopsis ramanniana AG]
MPDLQPRQRKKAAAKKQQNQPPAEPKTRAAKAAAAAAASSPSANLAQARQLVESQAWAPSFKNAFRLIFAVRCAAALYSILSDCDEVFNYWEPTHWLQYGFGLQTWEYSPEFAIRSWSYVSFHAILGWIGSWFAKSKIQVFYFMRIMLGAMSAFAEARFYRTVVEEINAHVGRYLLVALIGSAGMFHASVSYLPSSFSMVTTMLAFSFVLQPPTFFTRNRTYGATFFFGLGGLFGWPFCAILGVPFVIEELLVYGREVMVDENDKVVQMARSPYWRLNRAYRLAQAVGLSFFAIAIPILAIDYYFYEKLEFVPLNIVLYNVFGGPDRGPNIFGTEPWSFYIVNGFLNFNIIFLLALGSGVCVLITMYVDRNRVSNNATPGFVDAVSPYILLALKLVPFYIWLAIFTLQPHKEERFLFVAYPLICLNASIALFLVRGWVHRVTGVFGASISTRLYTVKYTTAAFLLISTLLSLSRILALVKYYGAPKEVYSALWNYQADARTLDFDYLNEKYRYDSTIGEKTLCVGKEWYRFPSSYFLPNDVRLGIIKSDFDGLMPKPFAEDLEVFEYEDTNSGKMISQKLRQFKFAGASVIQPGFNDLNKEDPSAYTDIFQCDFLVDSDFPLRYINGKAPSNYEPRYIQDTDHWNVLKCVRFLDAENSAKLSRAFWIPGVKRLQWGEYCLLERK